MGQYTTNPVIANLNTDPSAMKQAEKISVDPVIESTVKQPLSIKDQVTEVRVDADKAKR